MCPKVLEYVPALHMEHCDAAADAAYEPGEQDTQVDELMAPVAVENVPGMQFMQVLAPDMCENFPA